MKVRKSFLSVVILSVAVIFLQACTQGGQKDTAEVSVVASNSGTGSSSSLDSEKTNTTISLEERVAKWAKFAGIQDPGKIESVLNSLDGLTYDPKQFNPKVAKVLLGADPQLSALLEDTAKRNLIAYKTFSSLSLDVPQTEQEKIEAEEQGIETGDIETQVKEAEKMIPNILSSIAALRMNQSYIAHALKYFYDLEFSFNNSELSVVKGAFGDSIKSGNPHAKLAYQYVAAVTFTLDGNDNLAYTFFDLDFKPTATTEDVEEGKDPSEDQLGKFVVMEAGGNNFF